MDKQLRCNTIWNTITTQLKRYQNYLINLILTSQLFFLIGVVIVTLLPTHVNIRYHLVKCSISSFSPAKIAQCFLHVLVVICKYIQPIFTGKPQKINLPFNIQMLYSRLLSSLRFISSRKRNNCTRQEKIDRKVFHSFPKFRRTSK